MFRKLLLTLTHPLVIASVAIVVITEAVQTTIDKKAAILGGFFIVGILPNLLMQCWSHLLIWLNQRKSKSAVSSAGMLPTYLTARFELWYVFWFALLAVIYGTELFAHTGWMMISMSYAIYHGINLLVVRYFHGINPRISEATFWSTLLVNINPVYAFSYLLLLPLVWWHPAEKKLDFVALNWSLGIGLFSALLTWIS